MARVQHIVAAAHKDLVAAVAAKYRCALRTVWASVARSIGASLSIGSWRRSIGALRSIVIASRQNICDALGGFVDLGCFWKAFIYFLFFRV